MSLRASRSDCARRMECQDRRDSLTMFKTMGVYSDSSGIYKRPSPVIRFVHNLAPLSILTRAIVHATNGDLRTRVQTDSESSLPRLGQ